MAGMAENSFKNDWNGLILLEIAENVLKSRFLRVISRPIIYFFKLIFFMSTKN